MSEPKIIAPNGKSVVAKASIIVYSNGSIEFTEGIRNPTVSWVMMLQMAALQLNEQRLSELAAAVNQLLTGGQSMPIKGIDLAEVLKKRS
jgi:hypothetical protein